MSERGLTQKTAAPALQSVQIGLLQRQCACGNHTIAGGECEECRKKRDGMLQRTAASAAAVNGVPPIVHDALRLPGQPLDPATRAFMEPRFGQNLSRVPVGSQAKFTIGPPGDVYEREADAATDRVMRDHMPPLGTRHDFSRVRVHTGARAAESARAVNALAYTVGSDIVFAGGRYAPSTTSGQRLLAHELAHVIQQSAGNVPMVQRQINIPIFDEFDPCVIVSDQKVCGSDAKKVCEELPSLPRCSFVCRVFGCKKPEKPSALCHPGFRAATSKDFKGQCCIENTTTTTENADNCCPPARAAFTSVGPRCCAADEVAANGQCTKGSEPPSPGPTPFPGPILPCLPGEIPNLFGGCCRPGDNFDKQGRPCLTVPIPAPKPTPPPGKVVLHFNLDQPMPGRAVTEDTLLRSLTAADKSTWLDLLKQLQSNPSWRFQLVGKASPEGPSLHNLDLAKRRAQLVEKVLVDKGIERGRIVDVAPECTQVETGVYTCGEVGATDLEDRQVKVVFDVSTGANP
jgi:Domain of unknown function (DUF4157)